MRARVRLIIALVVVYLLAVALLIGCVVQGEMGSGDELPEGLEDSEQAQQATVDTDVEDPRTP